MVKFKTSKKDSVLIHKIIQRLVDANNLEIKLNFIELEMDLTACHANGNPLDLEKLLASPDSGIVHDVFGISRNIDRETGKLQNCFLPRYSL